MKSRICMVKSEKKIIAYNFNQNEQDNFKESLKDTQVIFVGSESIQRKIGEIAGLSVSRSVPKKADKIIEQKAVIFCGYNGEEVWTEIEKIKQFNIPLKAMLTSHNKEWSLGNTLEELLKEHNSFKEAGEKND